MLFIAIARTNSKYSYHYEKFEFLKYSYQKRMGRVLPKISDLFPLKNTGWLILAALGKRCTANLILNQALFWIEIHIDTLK